MLLRMAEGRFANVSDGLRGLGTMDAISQPMNTRHSVPKLMSLSGIDGGESCGFVEPRRWHGFMYGVLVRTGI